MRATESPKSQRSRIEPKTTGRVQMFSPPRSRLGIVRDKGLFARVSEGERESKRKRKRKGKKERERKKARESEREQEKESKKKRERAREREIATESPKSHRSRIEPKTTGRVQIFSPPRSRLGLVRD